MSTLLWIGMILIVIVGFIAFVAAVMARGKRRLLEKGDKDTHFFVQRRKVERMQRLKLPVQEVYEYVASEVARIFSSEAETEIKMNWLNSWGLILNHVLKPEYPAEVWKGEGFQTLHFKISEYAKQISSMDLDFPSRPDFDEVYARVKKEHPEHFK